MSGRNLYTVAFERLTDKQRLRDRWQELESKIDRPFFLSWNWIGVWVETFDKDAWQVSVMRGGETVALGVLVENVCYRHRFVRSRQLVLHATGQSERDVITIEYNGLLCDPAIESDIWKVVLKELTTCDVVAWDELVVQGATENLEEIIIGQGYQTTREAVAGSARIDLAGLADGGIESLETFVSTLGKNTRSQIRRSLKFYGIRGDIVLERAEDDLQAWAYLEEAGEYHKLRWEPRGGIGAMDRPGFVDFHRQLIGRNFSNGVLEVLRIRAGDEPFAWLYNFVDRRHVYFYFCAFRFEDDNRLKPGLCAHALCIADHLRLGSDVYDFMGGESRYKSSMGQTGPDIVKFAIQQRRFKFDLENRLRRLKRYLSDLRRGNSGKQV